MATHKYTIKGYRRKEESRTLCPQVETIEEGDEVIITVGKKNYRAIATIKDSNDPCRSCLLGKLCLVDEFSLSMKIITCCVETSQTWCLCLWTT